MQNWSNMGDALKLYAEALSEREKLLDLWRVHFKKGWLGGGSVVGDVEGLWESFEGHARRHRLPLVPGDYERTNRNPELDAMISNDAGLRAQFRSHYAQAMTSHVTGLSAAEISKDEAVMSNPLMSFKERKAGLVEKLKDVWSDRVVPDLRETYQKLQQGTTDADPVLFPGERVAKLSDLVGLQRAVQAGDFMGALGKYGIDMPTYHRITTMWSEMVQRDPSLMIKFGHMMG